MVEIKIDYAKPETEIFVDAVYVILRGADKPVSLSFRDIADLDYKKPPAEVFNNASLPMMYKIREMVGLRLMDTITTLAEQMGVDLQKIEEKKERSNREDTLQKAWSRLAQSFAVPCANDSDLAIKRIWLLTHQEESVLALVEKYEKIVQKRLYSSTCSLMPFKRSCPAVPPHLSIGRSFTLLAHGS